MSSTLRITKNFLLRCLLLVSLVWINCDGHAQGFLRARDKLIVNEEGKKVILRGIGLGGWMVQDGSMFNIEASNRQYMIKQKIESLVGQEKANQFYKAWLSNYIREIDIGSVAVWGFNSVRLPLHYNLFTLSAEQEQIPDQHTWREEGFALTDSLVSWCKKHDLYLILDMHAAPGGQSDAPMCDRDNSKPSLWESKANQEKTIALWKKLAERYAHEPTVAGYFILSEIPAELEYHKGGSSTLDHVQLRDFLTAVTRAIREADQSHMIIIDGDSYRNNYDALLPLWDKNLVLGFSKSSDNTDEASIRDFINLRELCKIPLWVDAAGENSNVWYTHAIRLMENNDIGWAWCPMKKIGYTNPLEIPLNPGYKKISDYWTGKGPKPSEEEAWKALKRLTMDVKLENCRFHKDLIDAMIRQARSNEARPFQDEAMGPDFSIEAVNYDLGLHGVAYYDKDIANYSPSENQEHVRWNQGMVYRNDGVDIAACNKATDQYYVANFETGEWLQYTVYVEQEGTYNMRLTVASEDNKGKVNITINNIQIKNGLNIPETGGPENWRTIDVKNVMLEPGVNVICVKARNGGFNLKNISFSQTNKKTIMVSRF